MTDSNVFALVTEKPVIENVATVYLHWDVTDKRWVVSRQTLDSHPLFGLDGGPDVNFTDKVRPLTKREQASLDEAAETDLPTGEQLIGLLQEALDLRNEE